MAKPDQLIKRRGKLGLVKVNIDAVDAKAWIDSMMGKEFTVGSSVFFVLESTLLLLFPLSSYSLFLAFAYFQVGGATGILNNFVVEPFIAHQQVCKKAFCRQF